ncbi:hypothetical protein ElyMa_003073000 [Elysia marginata]|uniref:Uncharacterized protein n=1 Tax=Elysia marginata TaxID=1093978 RepID=A0AAV4IMJ3_9GAST|nr:hypothetical protein ElyMa_003073000 [Elysia marginata]
MTGLCRRKPTSLKNSITCIFCIFLGGKSPISPDSGARDVSPSPSCHVIRTGLLTEGRGRKPRTRRALQSSRNPCDSAPRPPGSIPNTMRWISLSNMESK